MSEQVGVMRGVGYGRWGMHRAGLYFETWLPDDSATLQLLFGKDASRVMAASGVDSSNVAPLEGRSCRVELDGYTVRFTALVPLS